MRSERVDVVIIGGGIAGCALAATLAQNGIEVALVERRAEYDDIVRGEGFVPWGVAELKQLGLHELLSRVGHHTTRFTLYDPAIPCEVSEASSVDLSAVLPDVAGVLNVRHADACRMLAEHAENAGVRVLSGAELLAVDSSSNPVVEVDHCHSRITLHCRLVVGADGRNSAVRRSMHVAVRQTEAVHLMSGLLVSTDAAWPVDTDAVGTTGDLNFICLPQDPRHLRLYINHPIGTASHFAGPSGAHKFIQAFSTSCLPGAESLDGALPAGPCLTYAANDISCPTPATSTAVLVGDAAGYGDPIAGQGLSHAIRDARLVAEALTTSATWNEATFSDYSSERLERSRRSRMICSAMAAIFTDPKPGAHQRRLTALQNMQLDESLSMWFAALFAGSQHFPAKAFEPAVINRLFPD